MYLISIIITEVWSYQVALVGKNLPANVASIRNMSSIPGPAKSLQRRSWQPTPVILAWRIPMDRGACLAQSIVSKRVIHNLVGSD